MHRRIIIVDNLQHAYRYRSADLHAFAPEPVEGRLAHARCCLVLVVTTIATACSPFG